MVLDYNYTSSVKHSPPIKRKRKKIIPNPISMPCKGKGKKKK